MTRKASITPMWSSSPTPSSISSASSRQPVEQVADRRRDERAVAVGQVAAAADAAPRNRNIVQMTLTIIAQDHPGAAEVRAAEPGLAAERVRVVPQPDHRERRQADEAHDRDEVLDEAEEVPVAHDRDRPLRVAGEEDPEGLEVDRAQDHEGPEDEEVRGAGHRPLEQLALGEDLDDLALDRRAEPLGDVLDPVRRGLAAGDQPEQEEHPSTGHGDRDGQHHQPDDQHPEIHCTPLLDRGLPAVAAAYGEPQLPTARVRRILLSGNFRRTPWRRRSRPVRDTCLCGPGPDMAQAPPVRSPRNRSRPRVVGDLAAGSLR